MVFTSLQGKPDGWTLSFTRILSQLGITNGFLMTVMYRHGITIVNNKISRYRYFQNIAIYR